MNLIFIIFQLHAKCIVAGLARKQPLLVRLIPVSAGTDIHHQWHLQLGGTRHTLGHRAPQVIAILTSHLEDQLVVDLHDHAGLDMTVFSEPAMHTYHGTLDDVCCRTLHGGIDRSPLRGLATLDVARVDIGQVQAAPENRFDVSLPLCLLAC